MKILKLFLIFLIAGLTAKAQNSQQKIYSGAKPGMVLILNNDIIGSIELIRSVPPGQIQILKIHREEKLSSKENLFHHSDEHAGIMVAQTNLEFEVKTQGELNEFFGLNLKNDLYVNGYLLEDKNYKITTNSIARVEVIEPDNVFLHRSVLNITLK